MNLEKMLHKWGLIGWVSIVATVLIIILGLLAASLFYFFSLRKESDKESEARVQTAQNLKLLTSHSHPEAGEEWVVSFETEGVADLTIIPTDRDSVGDLDFVSLSCDGKEKAEEEAPQILTGDIIFYPNWQCTGKGELIHLVNIARKHILRFRFGNKAAFAYNNPDSVTDSFDDESKIAATSSVVITGGQAKLAACTDSGDGCSVDGDCCSDNCTNSICCAIGQTCCSSDNHCPADSCNGICTRIDNYCDTATDHYCKSTNIYCDNKYKCSSGSCISGSCDTSPNCDKKCSNGSCVYQNSSEDLWAQCSWVSCDFVYLNVHQGTCDARCGGAWRRTGYCGGSPEGNCRTRSCDCISVGTNLTADNGGLCILWGRVQACYDLYFDGTCASDLTDSGEVCECEGYSYSARWTRCQCGG